MVSCGRGAVLVDLLPIILYSATVVKSQALNCTIYIVRSRFIIVVLRFFLDVLGLTVHVCIDSLVVLFLCEYLSIDIDIVQV